MASVDEVENSEKVIIDELLCFIGNRLNLIDTETLIKLCEDTFDDELFEVSKDLLLSNLPDVSNNDASKKRRDRGDRYASKNSKILRDIICLLQENGNAKIPKFVAYDLGKLPPIGFDCIDVAVLFNKIQNSNTTIKILKDSISTVNESNDNLCKLIHDLDTRMKKLELSESIDKIERPIAMEKSKLSVSPHLSVSSQTSESTESSVSSVIKRMDDDGQIDDNVFSDMPFTCTKCGIIFSTREDCIEHQNGHDVILPVLYKCPSCDHNESSEQELDKHIMTHKQHLCDVGECKFQSSSETGLEAHKKLHTDEKLYNCDKCSRGFDKYEEYEHHFSQKHTEKKPCKCPKCAFECDDKATLERHIQMHTRDMSNKCPFCNCCFTNMKLLKQHVGTHLTKILETEFKSCINRHERNSSYNEDVRNHLIDSFLNIDGFSGPVKNGKPLTVKDIIMKDKEGPKSPHFSKKNKKSNNIGTGGNSSLGITTRKFKAEVFATRYRSDVDIEVVKEDLESNLHKLTGAKHSVVVEQLKTKFDHYSSFKITCFCEHTAVFMNSNIWPVGTMFKWWRQNKSTRQDGRV